jgi:putative alpha-1,2-mannosidase
MGDRRTFKLLSTVKSGTAVDTPRSERALTIKHEKETARPYSYGVTFEDGVRAEMTPTDQKGLTEVLSGIIARNC